MIRAAFVGLFFVVAASLSPGLGAESSEANSPFLTVLVCRANVQPCQTEINVPVGNTVSLGILIDGSASADPLPIVAWESHYRLNNPSVVQVVTDSVSGHPVREQGENSLALDSKTRLNIASSETVGYFTVQNAYDSGLGRLDYSVILTSFDSSAIQLDQVNPRTVIGRITLQGQSAGLAQLMPISSPADKTQVVILDSSGRLMPIDSATTSPAVTIKVGPVSTTELRGQLTALDQVPHNLSVTLWRPGAIPSWLGGNDLPLAEFRRITPNSSGAFRVTDIPESLVPPGNYDVRVKGDGSLARVLPNVTFPAAGPSQRVISFTVPQLGPGDLNGDNIVDGSDVQEIKASFGATSQDSGFNGAADFNNDHIVDVADFSRLSRNFGARGE